MEPYTTPEREEYIHKLESQMQAIDRILKMDTGTVVDYGVKKRLRDLMAESETVMKKLRSGEFEIAIVGMEKAGKSTLANALMESNLLPAKGPRCTFTSTRIEYSGDGQDDSATVSFYTVDTFDRDFKDKLRNLGFPNYERYSFDTLDKTVYESIYATGAPTTRISWQSRKIPSAFCGCWAGPTSIFPASRSAAASWRPTSPTRSRPARPDRSSSAPPS